jgi:hypothetical protein
MTTWCDDPLFRVARRDANRAERWGHSAENRAAKRGKERPISLAPIYKRDTREHLVNRLFDAMVDWRYSPFENEGPARHALRSALCLQGYGWSRADHEAANLVAEALRRLRAQRPSWEQGQREYLEPRENCRRCGGQLPEEHLRGGRYIAFCSFVCAKAHYVQREFEVRATTDAAYRAVSHAVTALSQPVRKCEHCDRKFQPRRKRDKFCSLGCAAQNRAARKYRSICQCCGSEFEHAQPDTRYCSATCRTKIHQLSTGRWVPKKISSVVLDFMFQQQGLRITPEASRAEQCVP